MSSTARSNRLTQVVVEAIVALAVVMAALTGLGYLIGPYGAGLVHGKPSWPLIGPGQYAMTVETELDTDVTITGAPTTTETTSGTVDAATGQRPAAVGRPITATVEFDGPTAGQRWAWAIWQAAGPCSRPSVSASSWSCSGRPEGRTPSTRRICAGCRP